MSGLLRIQLGRLCLAWMLVLVAAGAAAAGTTHSISGDFDGDGRRDRAELDYREPTTVRVRLSAGRITVLVRGRTPFIGLAACDLDGDARDELLTSDASSRLQVFTKRSIGLAGFEPFRPRRKGPDGLSRPCKQGFDDGSDAPVSSGVAFMRLLVGLVRSPAAIAVSTSPGGRRPCDRAGPTPHVLRSAFGPRPPPVAPELPSARV
jgi:hypothetical protein